VVVIITQAWRYNFFGFGINNIKNKTPAQVQAWIDSRSSSTTNVGDLNFAGTDSAGTAVISTVANSLSLRLTQAYMDPMYTSDEGWWFGQQTFTFASSMSPSNWAPAFNANVRYHMTFNVCCRISALRDGNNDASSRHWVWFAKEANTQYSIQAAGFPREFIETNVQLSTIYRLSAINRQQPTQVVLWRISGTACSVNSPGGSCLVRANPGYSSGSVLSITNNIAEWLPKEAISACTQTPGYCPYAINVGMVNNNVATYRMETQLDFLFIVQNKCTGTNCPPVFNGITTHTVVATVPFQYTFTVADPGGSAITVENTPIPEGLTVTVTGSGASRTITLQYDVDIDGPQGCVICFKSQNAKGMMSIGSFCPILTVVKPEFMFITGTMRTFTDSQAVTNGLKWTSSSPAVTAPVDPLPDTRVINFPSTTSMNAWFTTGTAKLYTFTMIRYYNSAADPFLTQDATGSTLPALPANTATPDPRRRV
jgi:hypothetical protein